MPSHKHVEAVAPDAVLGDRSCLAFSGTLVTFGTGRGVVVATGARTELGRINDLLGSVQQITTPLLRQMARFGRVLSYVVLGIATVAFFYGWLLTSHGPGEMFLAAVALAIAAIPEGLPAIMTITLAIGVRRMAQRNAIIRHLPAVDTLGSVTVICSDKTGTLTRNEMTVTTLALADGDVAVSGVGYAPRGDFTRDARPLDPAEAGDLRELLLTATLCTDSHLRQDDGRYRLEGAPTDGAMLVCAMKAGLDRDDLRRGYPEIDHLPFSSEHKYAARLVRRPGGGARIAVLGAPDRLLERCARVQHADGLRPLDVTAWERRLEALAGQGLRTLGVACKDLDAIPQRLTAEDLDRGLTLLGLAGIIDPPRDEAIAAVGECQSAGIRVIMITGDHKLTAQSIAGQIGIANATVRTGAELEQANDDQLRAWVTETSVYARVSPEHKLRLVTALQANGAVVAMTGDGVNDAPAIKRADVGVGMGITGTEVTKEAADMVLTDDNFASITSAVREGRTVYDNLRKAVLFILPTNGGEALTLLAAIALGTSLPLTAAQILWVNMVTAVTLALALAFEPPEAEVMRRPPRPTHATILDRYFLFRIAFVSLLAGLGTFSMFHLARGSGLPVAHAQTLAVNTLVAFELFYLFNTRFILAPTLSWAGLFGSRPVLFAVGLVALAQLGFTYLPFMQVLFGSASLTATDWLLCLSPGAALLLVVEAEKAITRARRSAAAPRRGALSAGDPLPDPLPPSGRHTVERRRLRWGILRPNREAAMSLYQYLQRPGPSGFGYGSTAEDVTAGLSLGGKTFLVTGCSSGLGPETMRVLALRGARVLGTARTLEKARAACAAVAGDGVPLACELSDPRSVRACVEAVLARGERLDALIANAGIMALPRREQAFGVELQLFTNHVGHFLLVTGLLDALADDGRVVMVSSRAHLRAPREGIRFDDLAGDRDYTPWGHYGQSKLANLLFAKELARRLGGTRRTANAIHPGVIPTNLSRHLPRAADAVFRVVRPLLLKTPAQGAATQVFVATHPSVATVTGEYFADCNLARPRADANDPKLARRLWEVTEELVARLPQ